MDISPINSVANNVNTAGFMAGGGFKKAFLSLVFQIPFAKGVLPVVQDAQANILNNGRNTTQGVQRWEWP